MNDFCLSQDLGRMKDYQATCITEVKMVARQRTSKARSIFTKGQQEVIYPEIHFRWIGRSQIGYAKLVADTKDRLESPQLIYNCDHVIDATGVGQAVIEFMRAEMLSPIGIYITGGNVSNPHPYGWSVPKTELIANFQMCLTRNLIKFSDQLDPDVMKQLDHEILTFKEKPTAKGNKTYAAEKESDHDDLIMSCMLNCWWVMKSHGVQITKRRDLKVDSDYSPYDSIMK